MDNLYNMKLGDTATLTYAEVLRVPGGWIFGWSNRVGLTSTFVPFNNEFQKEEASDDSSK